MGVQGLLRYILDHPSTRERVKLREFAKAHLERTGKQAELLCDFTAVVSWLLSSLDYAWIEAELLSPLCLLHGGLLHHYSERILSFVHAMESLGLSVVFFVEGAPVSEAHLDALYESCSAECDSKCQEVARMLQVCAGQLNMTQVRWSLSESMVSHVVFALEAEGMAKMVYCTGGALPRAVSYMQCHKHVCGILSSNTSYAVPARCGLFLLDLFPLDVRHPSPALRPFPSDRDLECEVVWSSWLADSLDLSQEQLAELALLAGDQYTRFHNTKYRLCQALDVAPSLPELAGWVRGHGGAPLELARRMKDFVKKCPSYERVMGISRRAYLSGRKLGTAISSASSSPTSPSPSPLLRELTARGGLLSPQLVSLVEGGVYWRPTLIEPDTLQSPRFCDITILIRTCVYALLGLSEVTEFGYITSGTHLTRIPVGVACRVDLSTLLPLSRNCRLCILYRLVTYPGVLDQPDSIGNLISAAVSEPHPPAEVSVSAVLACSLMIFMRASNCRLTPSPNIYVCELEALLISLLYSLAGFPALGHTHLPLPPARGLVLASRFSHLLDQVFWLGACLGLSRDLLQPGALFSTHQFLPFHLAGTLCEEAGQGCVPRGVGSELGRLCGFYQAVWELPPVLELRAELLKECVPPLCRAVEAFNLALEVLKAKKPLWELAEQLARVPVAPPPPPPPPPSRDEPAAATATTSGASAGEEFLLDVDDSRVSSVACSAVEGEELSSVQECNATEEDHFFSSQSLGPCDLMVESCPEEEGEIDLESCLCGGSLEPEVSDLSPGNPLVLDKSFERAEEKEELADEGESMTTVEGDSSGICEVSETGEDRSGSRPATNPLLHYSTAATAAVPPSQPDTASLQQVPTTNPHNSNSGGGGGKHSKPGKKKKQAEPPPLPIMEHREEILRLVREHTVVCIEGETGCGKSTKVPQFILDEALSQEGQGRVEGGEGFCRVLVTQPRRVAAIKLAERVASERGERLGSTVGYCVGGDHHRAAKTRLTYCTVGYLLQVLVHHPAAVHWYSHIILDEIHERSIDTDFAMLVVRKLVSEGGGSGGNTKVVIMSATMQGSLLVDYFSQQLHFSRVSSPHFVGTRHYPVQTFFLDQLEALAERSVGVQWHQKQAASRDALRALALSLPQREDMKRALLSLPLVTEFAMNCCTHAMVSQCRLGEAVLVFLPGISSIFTYFKSLSDYLLSQELGSYFRLFVLHSQVPLEDQRDAFEDPPPDVVHVILATNIAESSVTLPKLRMVINFGVYHQLQYDHKKRMCCLTPCWCSHASCTQRAGRAGRVFDGLALHLFTSKFYQRILPEYDPPEMLSAPLAKLVLQAKVIGEKLGMASPSQLLCSAIEQPSLEQMQVALTDLARLGALASRQGREVDEEAEITVLGHFALSLPLSLSLCRLVLYSLFFGVPFEGITIAAALSLSQDLFSLPSRAVLKSDTHFLQKLRASTEARVHFDGGQYSDSLAVCGVFREWLEFRNAHLTDAPSKSRFSLIQSFCRTHSVRLERLMQLESCVAQIADRVRAFVPLEHKIHAELEQLVSLGGSNQGTFHLPTVVDGRPRKARRYQRVEVSYCQEVLLVKALLAAAFSDQMMVGTAEANSPSLKLRKRARRALEAMKLSGTRPAESLVMYGLQSPNLPSLHTLASSIIPHRSFNVWIYQSDAFVSLMPKFVPVSGPSPSVHQQATPRGQKLVSTDGENSMWNPFVSEQSVAGQKLAPDLVYFWQYGERRQDWSVSGVRECFPRPQHPLLAGYRRLSQLGEVVNVQSWRQPSTVLLLEAGGEEGEGEEVEDGVSIGLAATMKSSASGSHYVSARDLTLLPNRGGSCTALLLLLAFQPLHASLSLLVEVGKQRVVGMRVQNQSVPFTPSQYLTRDDLLRVNALRKALSDALCLFGEDEALLPMEKIAPIHSLLHCMLSRSPNGPAVATSDPEEACQVLEWDMVEYGASSSGDGGSPFPGDEEGEEEEEEEEADLYQEFQFSTIDSFCFYPPMNCNFLAGVKATPIPASQLRVDPLFRAGRSQEGEGKRGVSSVMSRGQRSRRQQQQQQQQSDFKLSPLAKSFVPSPNMVMSLQQVSSVEGVACDHAPPPVVVGGSLSDEIPASSSPGEMTPSDTRVPPKSHVCASTTRPSSGVRQGEETTSVVGAAAEMAPTNTSQCSTLALFQPKPLSAAASARLSFDVSHMGSFFPDFPGFGPFHSHFASSSRSRGPSLSTPGDPSTSLSPRDLQALVPRLPLCQLAREALKQQLSLFMSNFQQLMLINRSSREESSHAPSHLQEGEGQEAEPVVEEEEPSESVGLEELTGEATPLPPPKEAWLEDKTGVVGEFVATPPRRTGPGMDPQAKTFEPQGDARSSHAISSPSRRSPTERFLEERNLLAPPPVRPHPLSHTPSTSRRAGKVKHLESKPHPPHHAPLRPHTHQQQQPPRPPQQQPRPPQGQSLSHPSMGPLMRYTPPSSSWPPAFSMQVSARSWKEACPPDPRGGRQPHGGGARTTEKEKRLRELSAFCMGQFRTRYQHPPWVSAMLCPPCKVDPTHVYRPRQVTAPPPSSLPQDQQEQQQQQETWDKVLGQHQPVLKDSYIPPVGSIWNAHVVTPAATAATGHAHSGHTRASAGGGGGGDHRKRLIVPAYKSYGIRDELVASFLSNYLLVTGGKCRLELLCGPVYKYFLHSCGVPFPQDEMLPVRFFGDYFERFSVSLEQEGIVVSLRTGPRGDGGEGGSGKEEKGVTLESVAMPPLGDGEGMVEGKGSAVVGEPSGSEVGGDGEERGVALSKACFGLETTTMFRDEVIARQNEEEGEGEEEGLAPSPGPGLTEVRPNNTALTQDVSSSSSFNLLSHSWPELHDSAPPQAPHGPGEGPDHTSPATAAAAKPLQQVGSRTYSIFTESLTSMERVASPDSWPHVDSDHDFSPTSGEGRGGGGGVVVGGVKPSVPVVNLNTGECSVDSNDVTVSWPDFRPGNPASLPNDAHPKPASLLSESPQRSDPPTPKPEQAAPPQRPSSAPGSIRAPSGGRGGSEPRAPGSTLQRGGGGVESPQARAAGAGVPKSSSGVSVKSMPDRPLYSPPHLREKRADKKSFETSGYQDHFISFCRDMLSKDQCVNGMSLLLEYKKRYQLKHFISLNFFHKNPAHFVVTGTPTNPRVSLARQPPRALVGGVKEGGSAKEKGSGSQFPINAHSFPTSSRHAEANPREKGACVPSNAHPPASSCGTDGSSEEAIVEEVHRILKLNKGMSFLSQIRREPRLAEMLASNSSVTLDRSFFEAREEYEVRQDWFEMDEGSEDPYILLRERSSGSDVRAGRCQLATSTTVTTVGNNNSNTQARQLGSGGAGHNSQQQQQRGEGGGGGGAKQEERKKKKKKKKSHHRPRDGTGRRDGGEEGGGGGAEGRAWRRVGSGKGRTRGRYGTNGNGGGGGGGGEWGGGDRAWKERGEWRGSGGGGVGRRQGK